MPPLRTRWRSYVAACACLLVHAAPVQPVQAQAAGSGGPGRGAGAEAGTIEFVIGNIEYLLVHELAHFLIAEKNVPIIGPEENAADYIATLALIREEPLDPAQRDRARRFLLAAAEAFAAAWQTGAALGATVPYWESHALGIQRYYQIACLLYGSDPVAFERVPEVTGLPEARARGCVAEYERADHAVDWLLANFGRQPGDPPGAATDIVYEEPPTLVARRVLRELRSLELLERLVERLHQRFTLERPFTLVMRTCGRAEAAWVPDRRELVLCYELVDTLYLLAIRAQGGGMNTGPLGRQSSPGAEAATDPVQTP